jgi:hypothetical protein
MNEELRTELKGSGWRAGTYRGYLMKRVAGIEFEVGPDRGAPEDDPRLMLRWRYHTESAHRSGEEAIPGVATRARIEDAMTAIYQRVHERPDPARVFGGRRRRTPAAPHAPVAGAASPDTALDAEEVGQTALDF